MIERTGEVTFKGTPQTVLGDKLNVGDKAPAFELVATDLSPVSSTESDGKIRLISVVPSIDTGICAEQTRRFDGEIAQYGDKVTAYTVSADLPFAQRRWAQEVGLKHIKIASDHRHMSFGDAYGTHIKELRFEQRSVFIVDADGTIRYVEYVPEVAQHPNYDAALAALKEVAA